MSISYFQTASQIITRALGICGVLADGQLPNKNQVDKGITTLNGLLNFLSEKEALSWYFFHGTQALVVDSTVSNAGVYYRCVLSHTSTADTQPGVGAKWTDVWYEDDSVSGTAVAWVLATPYTCSADFLFSSANSVCSAFLRYESYDYELKLRQFGEFLTPEEKLETGTPKYLYFDRQNSNRIFLNPIPDLYIATSGVVHLVYLKHRDEVSAIGDHVTIPPEWIDCFVYLLAANMADEIGVELPRCQYIQAKANLMLSQLKLSPHKENTDETKIKPCY